MLKEPSATILETGVPGVLSRADGSAAEPVTGILEDAIAERETGDTRRAAHRFEYTCPTTIAHDYGEGDLLTIGPDVYEILDTVAADSSFTIFLIC